MGDIIIKTGPGEGELVDDIRLMTAFAMSLKKLRKARGLSLVALGKNTGIPNQTLSTYENGKRIPSITQAFRIVNYFGYTIEDFIMNGLGLLEPDLLERDEIAHPDYPCYALTEDEVQEMIISENLAEVMERRKRKN